MTTSRKRSLLSIRKRLNEFLTGPIIRKSNKKKKESNSKTKSKLSKDKLSIITKDLIVGKLKNFNEAHTSTQTISSPCSMLVSQ